MKRDADVIRAITLATEVMPHGAELRSMDGIDDRTFFEHAKLMNEAGLLDCNLTVFWDDTPPVAIIKGLTWEGHDFANASRSETLWKKAKESVIAPTMSWTFAILKEWLKAEITKRLPAVGEL